MQNRANRRRGFTLVELIVVLVILAVLAALLVPALTGYIDRANEAKILAEARALLTASQATVSEAYAKGQLTEGTDGYYQSLSGGTAYDMAKQIWDLSDLGREHGSWQFTIAPSHGTDLAPAAIASFAYCSGGYLIEYHGLGTEDYDAGWDAVKRSSSLPSSSLDGPQFLESKAYDPGHARPQP